VVPSVNGEALLRTVLQILVVSHPILSSNQSVIPSNPLMKLKATPLLDPAASSFAIDDDDDEQLQAHQPRQFVDWLDQHKVLLLQRDDGDDDGDADDLELTVEDFGRFVVHLQLQEYPYIGGAAPRTIIPVQAAPGKDIVFTANERCVPTCLLLANYFQCL